MFLFLFSLIFVLFWTPELELLDWSVYYFTQYRPPPPPPPKKKILMCVLVRRVTYEVLGLFQISHLAFGILFFHKIEFEIFSFCSSSDHFLILIFFYLWCPEKLAIVIFLCIIVDNKIEVLIWLVEQHDIF